MTLAEYRKKAGYSQAKLAQLAGTSIQTIQRLEQNRDLIIEAKYKTLRNIWLELAIKLNPKRDEPLNVFYSFIQDISE